jgi:hypothetical protein
MNKKGNRYILNLVMIFILPFTAGFSQNQNAKPTRQSALDYFSRANYEQALIQFSELSTIYPKDPLYKYYLGVSLVKLERDPVKASTLLRDAQQGSAAIRTVPSDGLFYLGRAQQMRGDFSEALKSYNLYTEQVGKKIARENMTSQFVQQCSEGKGALALYKTPVITDETTRAKNEIANQPERADINKPEENDSFDKLVPEGYQKELNNGLNYQFSADSLAKLSDLYRKQLQNTTVADKPELISRISEIEQMAAANQKMANERILFAQKLIEPKTGQALKQNEETKSDSVYKEEEQTPEIISNINVITKDTLSEKKEKSFSGVITQKTNNQIIINTDKQLVTKDKAGIAQPKAVEIYSIFEISVRPVYPPGEKIIINPEVPAGLIYRIQIGALSKPVAPSYFKGISPVYGFKSQGSEITKYFCGMFRKSADASKALVKVKAAGFKDAFVVPLFNKSLVSAERAAILEREWGKRPFSEIEAGKIQDQPRDTIPQTLVFRVEAAKSPKLLTSEQLNIMKRLAGNRGLEIIKNESGQYIYLIGKFLTFESAAEYSDLLTRNGQKGARVAAYLGSREIPVETAKQLFEKF